MAKSTQLVISDKGGDNDLVLELDWAKRKDVGSVKATMGGVTANLDKGEFWKNAFIMANEETQEALVDLKVRKKRIYKKRFTFKLLKDLKAGELLVKEVEFDILEDAIPEEVLEKERTSTKEVHTK